MIRRTRNQECSLHFMSRHVAPPKKRKNTRTALESYNPFYFKRICWLGGVEKKTRHFSACSCMLEKNPTLLFLVTILIQFSTLPTTDASTLSRFYNLPLTSGLCSIHFRPFNLHFISVSFTKYAKVSHYM